jgi:hypothetical protein
MMGEESSSRGVKTRCCPNLFLGGSKARTPTFKKKGGPFCINSSKNVKNIHNKSHLSVCI